MKTKYLLTPGPVELPDEVRRAGAKPLISHRCPAFSELLSGIETKLSLLFKSDAPFILFPSSGTGALEALAVNFLNKNSRFISISNGTFGNRFREIALRTGATGAFIDVPHGEAAMPDLVTNALASRGSCDVLLLTHNETSTAVVNPIREIAAALPVGKRPLIFVDCVSSAGAMECYPQEWGVDGIATASQKGLMTAPGLGLVWLSGRAWDYLEDKQCPSYYFDLKLHRKELAVNSPATPYTPPVSLYYQLDRALDLILENGAAKWFSEKKRYAKELAEGLEAMGLKLLVDDEKYRSPGVTAIMAPDGDGDNVRQKLRAMGIEVAGGQGLMKNSLLRIAHYHDCGCAELSMILGALRAAIQ